MRLTLRRRGSFAGLFAICALLSWMRPYASADDMPVVIEPHYFAGQTLHYQFDVRSNAHGHTTGPIVDPEAASQFEQSSNFLIRLDILDVKPDAQGSKGTVRIRVTYEKVTVSTQNDAYDPQSDKTEQQLKNLEGHSIEFTLQPNGDVTDISGLDNAMPGASSAATNLRTWMAALGSAAAFPKEGISIGKKWTSERPLPDTPLAGTVWRDESTYLRNEACQAAPDSPPSNTTGSAAASPGSKASTSPDQCAVILTRFEIAQTHGGSDLTPDSYKRYGLRTSGKWTGTGETLESVSLRTGLISSITQTSNQDMDFIIAATSAPGRITYSGHVDSQMHVALVPEPQFSPTN